MTTGRGATKLDVYLATLTHPDLAALTGFVDGVTLDGNLRIANWRHNFDSSGDTFAPGFFGVQEPQSGDRPGTVKLAIDNLDQRVKSVVNALTGRATLTLRRVYAHQPDTIRNTWENLELQVFQIDGGKLFGTFGPPRTEGPFMGITINPRDYPGAVA